MRLFLLCISLPWGLTLAVSAQAASGAVRLATVFDGPTQMMGDVEALLVPSLSKGIALTSYGHYMAMADQLGVLWPYAPVGARRVGRALRLTHVALFRVVDADLDPVAGAHLAVRLVDVRTGGVTLERHYGLNNGVFAPSTAARVLAALRWSLLREKADLTAPLPQDKRPEPRRHGPGGHRKGRGRRQPGATADRAGRADWADQAEQESHASRPWQTASAGRRFITLGPTLSLRLARLSPSGAPCYCADGGFAPAILGVHLRASLYFDPNTTHFGLDAELAGGLANLPTPGAGADSVSSTQPWHAGVVAGYRFFDTAPVAFVPQVGLAYARFPIAQGAFVSTAYTTVDLGLRLLAAPLGRHVQLEAGGGFGFVVGAGYELPRLGTFQAGTLWRLDATPRLLLGRWQVAFMLAYEQIATHFRGSTALYTFHTYNNVSLTDSTLRFELTFGGQFW